MLPNARPDIFMCSLETEDSRDYRYYRAVYCGGTASIAASGLLVIYASENLLKKCPALSSLTFKSPVCAAVGLGQRESLIEL